MRLLLQFLLVSLALTKLEIEVSSSPPQAPVGHPFPYLAGRGLDLQTILAEEGRLLLGAVPCVLTLTDLD